MFHQDGGLTISYIDTATVYINVVASGANNAPIAVDDYYNVYYNMPYSNTVTDNDYDPEGDPLSTTIVANPTNGTHVFNPDGTFTYTPGPGFIGVDTFTYALCDVGLCDTANVYLNVDSTCASLSVSIIPTHPTLPTCDDGEALAVISGGTPPYTYAWADGSITNPATNLVDGTYSVTVVDALGCSDISYVFLACGATSCTANYTYSSSGLTVTLTGSTTWIGGTPINYVWDFDDGTTGTGQTITHTFPASGTYNICLTTGIDCPDTVCYSISVSDICPDTSFIDWAVVCPLVISPVCGCDGVTYANACEAENYHGVLNWTSGTCPTTPTGGCLDSTLIDNTVACPTVIEPVCGCDNVTYNNECEAAYFYGVSSWTPGDCSSEVWPGDCNDDLVANNVDLLSIGLAYGNTGSTRAGATLSWVGQSATNWATGISYVNDKHVDTNGDGIIDSLDAEAISLNYGLTHTKLGGKTGSGPELVPNFLGITSYSAGDVVTASIDYGSIDTPVANVYGIAYTIEYDPTLIVDTTIMLNFSGGWFNGGGNNLTLYKVFDTPGRIEVAQTKTDHASRAGYGSIASVSYVIQEDLAGKTNLEYDMVLRIVDVRAIDHNGNDVNAKTGIASATIDGVVGIEDNLAEKVGLYPNPTNDVVTILTGSIEIENIEVLDMLGKQISVGVDNNTIDFSGNDKGIYLLKLSTDKGEVVKKVVLR